MTLAHYIQDRLRFFFFLARASKLSATRCTEPGLNRSAFCKRPRLPQSGLPPSRAWAKLEEKPQRRMTDRQPAPAGLFFASIHSLCSLVNRQAGAHLTKYVGPSGKTDDARRAC
ncbi:MAG: hypothetical protein QOI46_4743, partial [Alphaproteobacteria bacterium]|nr:hypothetical protein [Alphaproteobacteria bacterium]